MKLVNGQVPRARLWTSGVLGLVLSVSAFAGEGVSFSTKNIEGDVDGSSVVGEIPPTAALFVMAYPAGHAQGMPAAVVRIPYAHFSGHFPVHFRIGPPDAMTKEQPFPKEMVLAAKLTHRGDAITKPGDWTTDLAHPTAAKLGESNIHLHLDPTSAR